MIQSENPAYAMPSELITYFAKLQGAGAAAPVRAPNVTTGTSGAAMSFASNNFISLTATDITRSGVGAYTAKLRDILPVVISIAGEVWSTTGAAAYKDVFITDYNPTTGVITFGTNLATSGAAVDLLSTDFLTFTIKGQKNRPVY
jgi:hypothetical protein